MGTRLELWTLRALGRLGRRPVRSLFAYLVLVVAVAAAAYALLEGVAYADGLWWAVVTLTTVGYGDIAPSTAPMRAVAVWVIASGLLGVAVITGVIAARMSVAAIAVADRTAGIDDDFDALSHDLADAVDRVRHLQTRFRLDERGDDALAEAAREVVARFERDSLDAAAVGRLRSALDTQRATDA